MDQMTHCTGSPDMGVGVGVRGVETFYSITLLQTCRRDANTGRALFLSSP